MVGIRSPEVRPILVLQWVQSVSTVKRVVQRVGYKSCSTTRYNCKYSTKNCRKQQELLNWLAKLGELVECSCFVYPLMLQDIYYIETTTLQKPCHECEQGNSLANECQARYVEFKTVDKINCVIN